MHALKSLKQSLTTGHIESRAIVESECDIPAMPVSDAAGAMADVSAPEAVPLF